MSFVKFDGEPGTTWTNDTGRAAYQWHCSLDNTCGACFQLHMTIANVLPQLHRGCNCTVVLLLPGDTSAEFVDFRTVLAGLPHDQQVAAVGASNYRLIEEGVVTWDDVVTPTRVRDLREVVAREKLTVSALTDAGVRPDIAERAFATVHTPAHQLAAEARAELVGQLQTKGVELAETRQAVAERLAARVSIGAGPSERPPGWEGGIGIGPMGPPKPPPLEPAEIEAKLGVKLKPVEPLHWNPEIDAAMRAQRAANEAEGLRMPVVIERTGTQLTQNLEAMIEDKRVTIDRLKREAETRRAEYDALMVEWEKAQKKAYDWNLSPATRRKWLKRIEGMVPTHSELSDIFFYGPDRIERLGEQILRHEADLATAWQNPNAVRTVTYEANRLRHPELIAPGPIEKRLESYAVGDAKVKVITATAERYDVEEVKLAQRRTAIGKQAGELMVKQAEIIDGYVRDSVEVPAAARAKVDAMQKEIDNLLEEKKQVVETQRALTERRREEISRIIEVKNGAVFAHTDVPPGFTNSDGEPLHALTASTRESVKKAQDWLQKIVTRGDVEKIETRIGERAGARAYFSQRNDHIQVKASEKLEIVAHEYGHGIDYRMKVGDDAVVKRSQEFLAYRCGDEVAVDMHAKFGCGDPGEMGRKDKFTSVFDEYSAYYTGKVYGHPATEVVSMGLQKLYEDPVGFARNDPEFCKFILGIADGSLR